VGEPRVSTVELFFDLVFVFTITQLTYLIDGARTPLDFLLVLVVLTIVWWHYAGYVWLTNASGAADAMRLVLVAAMAGFLVMAISLPTIFGAGGLPFGLGYLFIVALHLGAFLWQGGRAAWRAVAGLAVINLGVAALVLAAALVHASWSWAFLVAGVALFGVSTLVRVEGGFSVRAGHFAERHGAVILIALGESVIAIGTGAAAAGGFGAWTLGALVAALAVIAAMWWAYFDRDDARAEHALSAAPPEQQARKALLGYWYTHLLMIAGIVLVATGVRGEVAHPAEAAPRAGWLLAAGLAAFLLGSVAFRRSFGLRPLTTRLVAAPAMLLVGLAGLALGGLAVLALGALLLGALFAWERAYA
jgi:low temperature requirement protein LtrA